MVGKHKEKQQTWKGVLIMSKKYTPRFCHLCEEMYRPTGSRQKYCKNCTPKKRNPYNPQRKTKNYDPEWDINDVTW